MPVRSATPGLQRRKRKGGPDVLYWSAASLSKKAGAFPAPLIRLPSDATPEEIVDLCEVYTARLLEWMHRGPAPRFLYNGTIGSLCDCFERHPQSPIREVRRNTAESYADSIKVIRATVAKRAVRAVAPIDVKGWYARWRAPKVEGGPERVKRAHDAASAIRMILRFGAALGYEECGKLADALGKIQFERSPRREGSITVGHARAFIAQALKRDDARGLYMAIGVAAQFETMLRQMDVIGAWESDANGREIWSGPFTWENIPGGILRLRTSKTGTEIVHDLTKLDLLWPLIQSVPQTERTDAIKGDSDLPIRTRSYRKWFREIADAAEIPHSVWNMEARAGGVTEALEAGASLTSVQRAATHSNPSMTQRYDRSTEAAVGEVAAARKRARKVK